MIQRLLTRLWQRKRLGIFKLFLPLSWLYYVGYRLNRWRSAWITPYQADVPVWVIGNLTVGGTGKTPVVIALAAWLKTQGYQPGIISRGYGGSKSGATPVLVPLQGNPQHFGDEPVLIREKTNCPVVICSKRKDAIEFLRKRQQEVDIILSDDGLQHLGFVQDLRLVIIDEALGFGNQHMLPLGPLREPISRLNTMDYILYRSQQSTSSQNQYRFALQGHKIYQLHDPERTLTPEDLKHKTLHAVAGIGHPQHFFNTLANLGYTYVPHAFPDHHRFTAEDLSFGQDARIIMTEKDAIKCKSLRHTGCWVLSVDAILPQALLDALQKEAADPREKKP
jgi:tetraacyldisaccharide 4'-kinase